MGAKGKLRIVNQGHAAYCSGCEEYHIIYNSWQFNGDYDRPTFSPSLLVNGYSEKHQQDYTCHSFITDGNWQYLSDCSHDLKGQVAPLRIEDDTVEEIAPKGD